MKAEVSDKKTTRPRGRPRLGLFETKVRLSEETRDEILSLVGPLGMASFIRESVEAELRRRRRKSSPG